MAWGLCFLSTAVASAGARIIFRIRFLESCLCRYCAVAPNVRNKPSHRFNLVLSGCRNHASVLLPCRLEEAAQASIPNTGSLGLERGRRHPDELDFEMKLGLIAMSAVRAHNPELTALGLTLPGFVDRNRIVASLPSLSLLTLAALSPLEVETHYLEIPDIMEISGVPEEFDVVAISSYSAQIKDAYAIADRYRALGTKVLLGGLHVTAMPEEALNHADCIVLGEGEVIWSEILSELLAGRSPKPVYDTRAKNFNLAEAPVPRYELLDIQRYNRLTVQTQRGCPFRCEFCAASIQISPTYKVKPVDLVIRDVRAIKSLWRHPFIEFADDNTFVNKANSRKLMRELAKEQVKWFTETDLTVANDPELLELMRDAGCAQVLIGFESTTFSGLDGLEQRSNWKARQLDHYLESIQRIQSRGITVNGCFILGLDGTGPDSFEKMWNFVRESQLFDVQVTVQTAFPGTPLYARLNSEGRILKAHAWELCTLFDVNFRPSGMSVSDLQSGLLWLASRLYSEEFTKERKRNFHDRLRRTDRSKKSSLAGLTA